MLRGRFAFAEAPDRRCSRYGNLSYPLSLSQFPARYPPPSTKTHPLGRRAMNTTHGTTPRFAIETLSQVPMVRNGESASTTPVHALFKSMLQIWHGEYDGS